MNSLLDDKKRDYKNFEFRRDEAKRVRSEVKGGISQVDADLSEVDRLDKLAGSDPSAVRAAADAREALISRRAKLQERLAGAENGVEYYSRELKKLDMSDVEGTEERDGLISKMVSKIRNIASYGGTFTQE